MVRQRSSKIAHRETIIMVYLRASLRGAASPKRSWTGRIPCGFLHEGKEIDEIMIVCSIDR